MTSRREFLRVGLAAAALPIAARAGAHAAPPLATIPLYKVLYDTRFGASVEFARRAAASGLAVHAMAGDMTRFWYEDLYHRWRDGPAAIAGLTAHGALFCLERLAWDQHMRVVYRGEHAAADGCIAHRFEGAGPLLAAAVEATAEPNWAAALAAVVAACPRERAETRARQALTPCAAFAPSETLLSWVIAPVSRA